MNTTINCTKPLPQDGNYCESCLYYEKAGYLASRCSQSGRMVQYDSPACATHYKYAGAVTLTNIGHEVNKMHRLLYFGNDPDYLKARMDRLERALDNYLHDTDEEDNHA